MLELGDTFSCYHKVREFLKYLLLSYRQRGILENICSTDVTPRGGGVDILYILYANGEAEKGANLQEKGRKKRDKGKMDGKKIKYLQIRGGMKPSRVREDKTSMCCEKLSVKVIFGGERRDTAFGPVHIWTHAYRFKIIYQTVLAKEVFIFLKYTITSHREEINIPSLLKMTRLSCTGTARHAGIYVEQYGWMDCS